MSRRSNKVKGNLVKVSFYYRNQEQYLSVLELLSEVHTELRDKETNKPSAQFNSAQFNRRRTRLPLSMRVSIHSPQWSNMKIRRKMPVRKQGNKKYMGTISIPQDEEAKLSFGIDKRLVEMGLELVPKTPSKPKFDEKDLTSFEITIKSPRHLRKIASVLNKKFGHGNWKFRKNRNLMTKLKDLESRRNEDPSSFRTLFSRHIGKNFTEDQIKNGLKVELAAPGNKEELEKALFKADLMA